jgi:two-component system, OmpR family, phosphate regulon sensor histidine kinase PhoR
MKRITPITLIIIGSISIALFALLGLVLLDVFIFQFPLWIHLVFPLFIGSSTFIIFFFFTKNFINDRLRLIYRAIRKGKFTPENQVSFNLNEDILDKATKETKNWLDNQVIEINKLKEQENFRREFLGNLAHELKTPVFSIQGYIDTLIEGAIDDENVNQLFLERAAKATERITSILDDLDQITKLEVDQINVDKKPFDIIDLAKDVIDSFDLISKDKKVKIKLAKDYQPINVLGERGKIAQVFSNLINNSINYGKENGQTVIRLYNVDDLVTIEISDNGLGIEERHLTRLFERFYRVEKSRNRNEGGSGLGLAIVKHIVESHGQSISVRSTLGIGSTFSFTLDRA